MNPRNLRIVFSSGFASLRCLRIDELRRKLWYNYSMLQAKFRIVSANREGVVPTLMTVLNASMAIDAPLTHNCGGRGRCGTCAFMIVEGAKSLGPKTPVEKRICEGTDLRLGCQARIIGDLIIDLPPKRSVGADDENPSAGVNA
ncbi:MAG: (2Fe-2S)-binding protein [Planctomycetes bacterium]|nr:(2Fe-2S)-binding protein [Planctomycetota bacterium]